MSTLHASPQSPGYEGPEEDPDIPPAPEPKTPTPPPPPPERNPQRRLMLMALLLGMGGCEATDTPPAPVSDAAPAPDLTPAPDLIGCPPPPVCISRVEGDDCAGRYECVVNADCLPVRCRMGIQGVCLRSSPTAPGTKGWCFYGNQQPPM